MSAVDETLKSIVFRSCILEHGSIYKSDAICMASGFVARFCEH